MAALPPLHWAGLTVILSMSEARLILGIEMAGHRTRTSAIHALKWAIRSFALQDGSE